jgi:monoamine oxidase
MILEGRDRVGGRMHQAYLPKTNHLIDVGPNWIHGTENNPILDLAKETHTDTHSWGEKFNLFDEYGHYVRDEETAEYNEIMWMIIGEAFKHSNEEGASIPVSQSLYDFFISRLKEHLPATEKDNEKKRKILLQMSKMWGGFVGSTIEKQSLKFFWLEETIEGGKSPCST